MLRLTAALRFPLRLIGSGFDSDPAEGAGVWGLGFHERFPGWFRIHAFTLRLTSCRLPLRIPAGVDVPCRHLGRRQRTWNLVAASFSLPNPPIPKPQTPTPSAALLLKSDATTVLVFNHQADLGNTPSRPDVFGSTSTNNRVLFNICDAPFAILTFECH
jgi:hypothetical protein